jgi:hypothetical protein
MSRLNSLLICVLVSCRVPLATPIERCADYYSASAQASSQECQPATGSLWRSRSNNSLAPLHLGIITIFDLEPRRALCRVRR